MNHLEKAVAIADKGKELTDRLQPIEVDLPRHLKAARGFLEWKWEAGIIEVSVFARLRFYDRMDGGYIIPNPKMRYDLEIGEDAFLDIDNDLLYDMIIYSIDRAFSGDRLGPEYVLTRGMKHGFGGAVEFVDLDGGAGNL